jgi:hypothetical protein
MDKGALRHRLAWQGSARPVKRRAEDSVSARSLWRGENKPVGAGLRPNSNKHRGERDCYDLAESVIGPVLPNEVVLHPPRVRNVAAHVISSPQ